MNQLEKDLLALTRLFEPSDEETGIPAEAAHALLDFVERTISSGRIGEIANPHWHEYLNLTGRPRFLESLPSPEDRHRWADMMFNLVETSGYTLRKMWEQRVSEHPKRPYFRELDKQLSLWSYEQVYAYMKKIAAAFYTAAAEPRVLIYMDNSPEGASADLACLTFGILDSPIDRHFDQQTIEFIVRKLGINIVVTDTESRLHRLIELQNQTGIELRIFVTDPNNRMLRRDDFYLGEACAHFSNDEAEAIIEKQPVRDMHTVSTVMFTSGSTGEPKGVAFTNYNLVTKRFARAAALPKVGNDEVLFCYLPLFHTFGRYLEMMGMLYWGGTYVFAGNTSRETFIRRLCEVQPTGLIGIPLRWRQIEEHCLDQLDPSATPEVEQGVFRSMVGPKLRWGLSAAGFLSPRTFKFFHRNQVELCSGFGMTEATGGITMTPPEEYIDNSVGAPLPGMAMRLTSEGELEIGGPYLARYLEQLNDSDPGNASFNARTELDWLKTGDLFEIDENGHYEIVDRVKDIYKNNRGQTVAPRRVEKKFNGVPGIKNVFLVGDARDYNVLLIVPDQDEQMLAEYVDETERERYYQNIVTAANQELMPYERVVNIALLERDFSLDKGELTPKGSFRRKQVEKNFKAVIDRLYVRNFMEFDCPGVTIRVPRWFFRDLGVLEADDIECSATGLYDKSRDRFLPINAEGERFRIGDLEYEISGDVIDLGIFALQPMLWAGNPALLAFCPCKEGWDVQLKGITTRIFLPFRDTAELEVSQDIAVDIADHQLREANQLFSRALYGAQLDAAKAIEQLEEVLETSSDRMVTLIRNRLQTLARHPVEDIRCQAYSIMLLNRPTPDYRKVYPAFLNSGLSFLNDDFIHRIGQRNIERRRLEALRLRMLNYRLSLEWPVTPVVRDQLGKLLTLMADFVRTNPEYFHAIRGELASWIVQRTEDELMRKAKSLLTDLSTWYEAYLDKRVNYYEERDWNERMVFEEGISGYEVTRLKEVFTQTTFLHKSIALAFDVHDFDLMQVPEGGIWFSRLLSQRGRHVYRASVNTTGGGHYELMVTLLEQHREQPVRQVLYWLMAISDHPRGPGTLPRFGCSREDLGVLSVAYINDLTAWERIREYSSQRTNIFARVSPQYLRKLFTRAMSAFFAACQSSGYQVVPGHLSPTNVVVPEPDYRVGATILSLSGSRDYQGPADFVRPLIKSFYEQTTVHYPWSAGALETSWLFDACIEGLGVDDGRGFLNRLETDLGNSRADEDARLLVELGAYIKNLGTGYYAPMPLVSAIERYKQWEKVNPEADPMASVDLIDTLFTLYQIDRFGEIARYYMYRHTYFGRSPAEVHEAFDYLLGVLHENPDLAAVSSPALSDLQSTLESRADRRVFGHLVFPRTRNVPDLEVLAVGDRNIKLVIIKSEIFARDGTSYFVREATEPAEIGQLYRLFLHQRYPKRVSVRDQFLVLVDDLDRLVGGVCFETESDKVVYLDGIVIARQLQSNGLGSALLEDFCMRMANYGFEVARTHFYRRNFYQKRSFQTDRRWGGLVRFLEVSEKMVPGDAGIHELKSAQLQDTMP